MLEAGALLMVCAMAFWLGTGRLGITDLDEGLYAAAAREMAASGDWVTPRVNGVPFFEKPPLIYWLAALTIRAFGATELAARLPSACAVTVAVCLTWLFGRRRLGRRAGLLAACFLALAPIAVAAGRMITTDALLMLCVCGALYACYETMDERHGRKLAWTLVASALCGLGVLAKGLPGVAAPVAVVAIARLVCGPRSRWSRWDRTCRARVVLALLAFVAVAAPWHVAALRQSGRAFTDEYIVRQHLQRFGGGDRSHRAPFWFFVPGFLVGFFPWSAFTVMALGRRAASDNPAPPTADEPHAPTDAAPPVRCFLKVWFWFVFAAFSASGSKLVSYILPLYPAAALLAGDWADNAIGRSTERRRLLSGGLIAFAVLLGVTACALWPQPLVAVVRRYSNRPISLSGFDGEVLSAAAWPLGAAALGLAAFCVLVASRRAAAAFGALIASIASFVALCATVALPVVQARAIGSLHDLARLAGHRAGRDDVVWIAVGPQRRPSALYYLPDHVLAGGQVREGPFVSPQRRHGVVWLVAPTMPAARPAAPGAHAVAVRSDYTLWRVPASAGFAAPTQHRRP